jgi:hypothetical protein
LWLTSVILATGRQRSGGSQLEACPGQIVPETLSPKYLTEKRAGRMAQVIDHLPCKREAEFKPQNHKKKKKSKDCQNAFSKVN